eukprot:6112639-Pleurochrysis_carterae.AAC.1
MGRRAMWCTATLAGERGEMARACAVACGRPRARCVAPLPPAHHPPPSSFLLSVGRQGGGVGE